MGMYLPIPRFGAYQTVGASAPIFGLLGALMHYGSRSGSSMVYAEARGYALAMIIFWTARAGRRQRRTRPIRRRLPLPACGWTR